MRITRTRPTGTSILPIYGAAESSQKQAPRKGGDGEGGGQAHCLHRRAAKIKEVVARAQPVADGFMDSVEHGDEVRPVVIGAICRAGVAVDVVVVVR